MDNALIIRVRRGPGHTVLTATGETGIATLTRLPERLLRGERSRSPSPLSKSW
jgi:hypothetical protein